MKTERVNWIEGQRWTIEEGFAQGDSTTAYQLLKPSQRLVKTIPQSLKIAMAIFTQKA